MSTEADIARVIAHAAPAIAGGLGLPAVAGFGVEAAILALSRLLAGGRSPEEVTALLMELHAAPPGTVDLDAVEARVRAQIAMERGEE